MFEIINNTDETLDNIDILNNYLEYITKRLNIENAIFNIIFITDAEIRKINKEYRNIDRVTDVISFALEEEDNIEYNNFRLLGDIYICVSKIYEQANIYNHSNLREMCFLATHGLLHLLGYDHMTEEEEKEMFTLQEDLLDEYNIKR